MSDISRQDISMSLYDSDTDTLDFLQSEYEHMEMRLPPRSRGFFHMVALTIGLGGLQLVFAVQWSYGSAYLISLGLSKTMLGVVWVAGPLSGVLIQPVIGAASDRCQSPWGRRRPFIAAGGAIITTSLLCLAWCQELVYGVISILLQHLSADSINGIAACVAIFFFFLLNIGIQPLQAGLRALIVDSCPSHQQEKSTAYAGFATSIGSMVGFIAGFIDLPRYLSIFGNSQFNILCALTSLELIFTLVICCYSVEERQFRPEIREEKRNGFSAISKMFHSFRTLSPATKQICKVQFFAWMGWSPFLFYITIYVAEIYERSKSGQEHQQHSLSISVKASRYSSFVLLLYAVTSCVSGLTLCRILHNHGMQSTTKLSEDSISSRLRPSLKNIWLASHLFYAACMLSIPFITTTQAVTIIVCLLGIPWSITIWVPYALIGIEISGIRQAAALGSNTGSLHDSTGAILGVHNAAIALPQILATLGASLIFWGMGNAGLSWVIACGGLAALGAAVMTAGVVEREVDF